MAPELAGSLEMTISDVRPDMALLLTFLIRRDQGSKRRHFLQRVIFVQSRKLQRPNQGCKAFRAKSDRNQGAQCLDCAITRDSWANPPQRSSLDKGNVLEMLQERWRCLCHDMQDSHACLKGK